MDRTKIENAVFILNNLSYLDKQEVFNRVFSLGKFSSIDLNESHITTVEELAPVAEPSWPNYLLGVVAQFLKAGITINGFDAALTADIPMGAGLSSSAAVECAMAMALNNITTHNQI